MAKRERADSNTDPSPGRLQESNVFITEYVNETTKFSAIIKQRFSDFHVFEIDEDGNEVHLTSLENNLAEPEAEKVSEEDNLEDVDVNEQPVSEFHYPFDDEKWRQLTLLLKRKKKNESINIDVTGIDKNERTAIHGLISKRYDGNLCTKTIDEGSKKLIIVSSSRKLDTRQFDRWPKDVPKNLHFVMYKENLDTISAVRLLCKMLKRPQKCVSYSGTKDRRGVTTQRICIRQVTADQVSSHVNKYNIWCGHYEYKDEPLRLGQLRGNRFAIVLRNVQASDKIIDDTLTSLKEQGFINYYGLQRFGSNSMAPTYEIGKYLLQKRWMEAVHLVMVPPMGNKYKDIREAVEMYKAKGDPQVISKIIRGNYSNEAIVLRTLIQQGSNAYVNALQKIPRNIILLYLHAFQSLVWNRIVSRRIKEHGLKVLVGDLVCTSELEEVDEVDEAENYESEPEKFTKIVKVVTPEEVDKTSIYDVVCPLPGYAVKYPENEISKWYTEVLREYEICDLGGKNKTFTSPGAYRKILTLPQNVTYRTVFYDDPSADLLITELQKLKNDHNVQNLESGAYKAVIVELALPNCSYATMALREITKLDTSADYQASLSFSHVEGKKVKVEDEADENLMTS